MVPNGEAIRCARARAATAGWRASNAPKSWKAIVLGSSVKTSAPIPTGTKPFGTSRRRRRLRDTTICPLTRHRTKCCPRLPPDWRQCDKFFYGLINLAKALTNRARAQVHCRRRKCLVNGEAILTISQLLMRTIAAFLYPRTGMLFPTLSSIVAGQSLLLAGLCIAVLTLVGILHRRLGAQNGRLRNAIDNMSQGLLMFDAQGRIALVNRRYIDMYQVSPQIVRPGCPMHELIQHRKDTGLFSENVEAYCQKIMDSMRKGQSTQFCVQASDGRIVLAKNEPLPGGGWVSTHEDVT